MSYPVGRSSWGTGLLLAGWALAAGCILAWTAGGASGWRAAVGWAALAGAAAGTAWSWWRTPAGHLTWDGTAWWFRAAGQPGASGRLAVALDLQSLVLVRWQGGTGRWFWLERGRGPASWDALRRAVYSRPDDDAPSGAQVPPDSP